MKGKRPDGLSTDEREEPHRLRRENQTLRMEREILKKYSRQTKSCRQRSHGGARQRCASGLTPRCGLGGLL
jgi:transposase-like protein